MKDRATTHKQLDAKYESSAAFQYGRYANNLTYDDLPDEVVHQAKRSLLDTLAVSVAAHGAEGATIAEDVITELGGTGEATVFGSGRQTSAPNAALVNGILVRHLDYNDSGGGGHNSDAIPGILAVAEREGSSPEKFLTSVVLSYELGSRVKESTGGFFKTSEKYGVMGDYRAGMSMPPCIGRLMGLSDREIANAIGSTACRNFPLSILDGDYEEYHHAKNLRFSTISYDAIMSCLLAEKGFTGPINIVEGFRGIDEAIFDGNMNYDSMVRFDDWRILDVAHKLLCTNHSSQGGILSVLSVVREHDIDPEDVKSVRVFMGESNVEHTGSAAKMYPRNGETANHSAYYATAHAIAERSMGPESHDPEKFDDPVILGLYDKITVEPHPDLPAHSRVGAAEITTKDGNTYRDRVTPPGMDDDPNTPEDMRTAAK
jgi:2-methylcitrate dehydratase